MRFVDWEDEKGRRCRSLIRDKDPDSMAPMGVLVGPPSLDGLNWEEIKRDLHNALFDRELFTFEDVQKSQNGLSSAIRAVFNRRLMVLYRAANRDS